MEVNQSPWMEFGLDACHFVSLESPKEYFKDLIFPDPSDDPLLPCTSLCCYLKSLVELSISLHTYRQVVTALSSASQVPGGDCLGGLSHTTSWLSQFKHPESRDRYWTDDACSTLYFGVTSIGLDLHVAWFGVIIVGPFLVSVSRAAGDILWIDCLEKSFLY